jgi:hypothetical protein
MTVTSSQPYAVRVPSVKSREKVILQASITENKKGRKPFCSLCDCVGSVKVRELFREINNEQGLTE